jgi:hypothetical protein
MIRSELGVLVNGFVTKSYQNWWTFERKSSKFDLVELEIRKIYDLEREIYKFSAEFGDKVAELWVLKSRDGLKRAWAGRARWTGGLMREILV